MLLKLLTKILNIFLKEISNAKHNQFSSIIKRTFSYLVKAFEKIVFWNVLNSKKHFVEIYDNNLIVIIISK